VRRRWWGLIVVATVAHAAASTDVQPYSASYSVEWRGMGAGTSTVELTKLEDDRWSYTSRNLARGLFKLALPNPVTQSSVFRIRDGKVTPLTYRVDDGSRATTRDISLDFDWTSGRVTGTAEDESVDLEAPAGAQDALTAQIVLMRELLAGREPGTLRLIDKDEVKIYDYAREGTETVKTPLGEMDTVIYRSSRQGSNRVTRLWLAPSLGYVPVRAQQRRGERTEFTMLLRSLKR
jgi:Protein of unknown function (DUF3108)